MHLDKQMNQNHCGSSSGMMHLVIIITNPILTVFIGTITPNWLSSLLLLLFSPPRFPTLHLRFLSIMLIHFPLPVS
jgi:hypothetical protein